MAVDLLERAGSDSSYVEVRPGCQQKLQAQMVQPACVWVCTTLKAPASQVACVGACSASTVPACTSWNLTAIAAYLTVIAAAG